MNILDGGSDDTRATSRADNEVELAVGSFDDRGRDGGEWAFTGSDIVCYTWDITKGV
jgi:hypothetical protein